MFLFLWIFLCFRKLYMVHLSDKIPERMRNTLLIYFPPPPPIFCLSWQQVYLTQLYIEFLPYGKFNLTEQIEMYFNNQEFVWMRNIKTVSWQTMTRLMDLSFQASEQNILLRILLVLTTEHSLSHNISQELLNVFCKKLPAVT